MYKKTITFTDYNGIQRTEDHLFNLSKAELIMMESSVTGGMEQKLRKIVESQDNVAIMEVFKDLIHRSYGKKSDDGRRFIKSDEFATEFEQTEAYSELVVGLLKDPDEAALFVNGIMPPDLMQEAAKLKTVPETTA